MPSDSIATTASKSARARVGVGRRAPDQLEELALGPGVGRARGDDLLREDVEGRLGRQDAVQLAGAHRAEQRRRLDQLVARRRVDAPLGDGPARVARAADPLEQGGDAARRADLADQLDGPDVDAELERGRGDQGGQVARAQPRLEPEPAILGQAAVMGGDLALAEPLRQEVRDPLGQAARVDEDERRPVRAHVRRDAVQDLAPLLVGCDGFQLAVRAARS